MTTAEQRKAAKLAAGDLAAIEMNQLRESRKVTQHQLAGKLKVTQAAVSRLERRADMHLSTLREFVRALGGQVEIRAVFRDGSVQLKHVGGAPSRGRSRRKR
ncbi:MAG TPA: XRE family transcriptional regulator [Candidatus Dormibacteraeota bacterium]|nr:XRE family transcriptional regulator [Candidatus Dormibacteraeota bacterium]